MFPRATAGFFATLTLLLSPAAQAVDVQNFKPAPGTWNYFTVEGARTARHLEVVPSLVINYGHQPLVVRDDDDEDVEEEIIGGLLAGDFMLTLGFFDRIELSVGVNAANVTGERLADEGNEGFALGDVRILPKFNLFGLKDDTGFGMALAVPIAIATGDTDKFIGAGQVVANPKLIFEGRGAGFGFATNVGFRARPDSKTVGNLDLSHEVTYGVAGAFEMGTEDVVLLTELYGASAITDVDVEAHSNPLEALIGLRIWTGPGATFTLGAGAGLIPDYGTPLYRILLGFAWHDRRYDADQDGILDKVDSCPNEPEDKDGHEDKDGCPEPDNDFDGILDAMDQCPLEPEDKDKFEDLNGCPDPDNDGDTILDKADICPNDPETVNGFEDTDGCPDEIPDTDGDGIKDPQDKCPKRPEDKDGYQDEDGCPDLDNDKDGIADKSDKCPMQPETQNGFEDIDGCPDVKPEGPRLVRVTKQKIEILEKVFFHSGKAKIKRESYDVLNQVAEVMIKVQRIKGVQVEGHTDSRGSARYNKKLSQRRADSVRNYLIGRGVETGRLSAVGFGEEVPIDDNKTKEGRANNRRVEFTIKDQ